MFRIGVNLGDVVVEGEDLLGDGVNVAARLEQLCEPGGVLVSGTAYDHLQGKLGLPLRVRRRAAGQEHRPTGTGLPPEDGGRPRAGRGAPGSSAVGACAAALAAVLLVWGSASVVVRAGPPSTSRTVAESPIGKPSIAVLPFDNLGGDEATGRASPTGSPRTSSPTCPLPRPRRHRPQLRPRSTRASRSTCAQVGKDLNVRYVLEGSIQRQATRSASPRS